MARVVISKKKTTIFKRKNHVANCPICGKFYNSKKEKS